MTTPPSHCGGLQLGIALDFPLGSHITTDLSAKLSEVTLEIDREFNYFSLPTTAGSGP